MIYYNDSPPMGLFNRFINDKCLEDIAAFIIQALPSHGHEWKLTSITEGNAAEAEMAYIGLARSRSLYVSGDTLYFCCTFNCGFYPHAGFVDVDEAEGTALDVIGKILFHPPGTKKYDLTLSEIHVNYQYPRESENYDPHFPGVRVSQMLHPAFGYNEEQRHKKLEEEADRFLAQYYPDALDTASPVPLRRIAEDKMCLQVFTGYRLPDRDDSLGLTVFRTQRIAVTDEEIGEQTIIRFPRGSVIIDANTMWDRGFGSFNFTLAHEIYHWFAHRVHMAFMDIMGRPDDYDAIKGHLESQADSVGARILMPRDAVIAKYADAVDNLGGDDADTYELAVTECAAFFGASKTAMKKRLHELGLHEETRRPAVRRRLDIVEMFTQYATDKGFRDLLDSGAYRYIRGFVVRNDPRYIDGDGLTLYAKEHLAECTMTFREQYRRDETSDDALLFRKDAYFSRTADYDRRMAESPELMKKLAEKMAKLKELYISSLESQESFCQFIMPIITDLNTKYMGLDVQDEVDDGFKEGKLVLNPDKRYRSRFFLHYDFQTGKTIRITEPEVFQDKTLVGYKMFEKIRRNDWNNPDLDMVMAVCAGYHLDEETTEKALLRAGYLLTQHNPRHLVFRFLTAHCRGEYTDTGTFNTLLILLGEKEIGTNKHEKKK